MADNKEGVKLEEDRKNKLRLRRRRRDNEDLAWVVPNFLPYQLMINMKNEKQNLIEETIYRASNAIES